MGKGRRARARRPDEHRYEMRLQAIRRLCDRWGAFYCGDRLQPDRPVYRLHEEREAAFARTWIFRAFGRPDIELLVNYNQMQDLTIQRELTVDGYELAIEGDDVVITGASTKLPSDFEDPGQEPAPYQQLLSREIDPLIELKDWQTLTFLDGTAPPVTPILSEQEMRSLFAGNRVRNGPHELFYENRVVYCAIVRQVTARGKSSPGRSGHREEWPADIEKLDRAIAGLDDYLAKLIKYQHLRRNWAPEHRYSRAGCSKKTFNNRLREAYAFLMAAWEK